MRSRTLPGIPIVPLRGMAAQCFRNTDTPNSSFSERPRGVMPRGRFVCESGLPMIVSCGTRSAQQRMVFGEQSSPAILGESGHVVA
jgi:hypothetical protein